MDGAFLPEIPSQRRGAYCDMDCPQGNGLASELSDQCDQDLEAENRQLEKLTLHQVCRICYGAVMNMSPGLEQVQ